MSPLGTAIALAAAEACLAIFFGAVYRALARAYPRHDMRLWAQAWTWLLAHIVAAAADAVVAGLADGGRPWRVVTIAALVATSNLGLLALHSGVAAFTGDEAAAAAAARRRRLAVAVAVVVGIVVGGGFVPAAWSLALSEGIRAAIACLVMAATTRTALRSARYDSPGSALTLAGLGGLTLAQGNYAVMTVAVAPATRDALLPYLGILDWQLWVVLGVGATTWLLHRERTTAVEEAKARQALEQSLVERERRFAAIIDGITERIFVVDGAGRIAYSAPRPLLVDAFTAQDLEGQSFESFIHPDDLDEARAVFARILATPNAVLSVTCRVRMRSGGWIVYECHGRNLLSDPSVHGILITARDVTERVRLQAQLHDAQRMESIGRLAGGIAHDFNNLLTVIAGNAEFGRALLPPDAPAHGELQQIEAAAERAATLTRQLLSFARRQIVEPTTLDLGAVVEGLGEMTRRLAGGHIAVAIDTTAARPMVHADRGQLEQVLLNLVANARDAMPEGGRLTIVTGLVELGEPPPVPGMPAGPFATLAVSDTGVGMADDVKPHVFEPFFTTKARGAGTGLGLASCYGIVSQHGGFIGVESAVGQGSTFTVYLPAAAAPAEKVARPGGESGARGRERVLVVEDEAAVRQVASSALRARGFDVIEAADGLEARRLLELTTVDCIVSDVAMPGQGGPAMVKALRDTHARLPVILTSGYVEQPAVIAVLDEVTEFLPKPYTGDQLAAKVRGLVDRLGVARR